MSDLIKLVLIVALILALVFVGPWFTILMLNTLFGLNLTVGLGTWFAAFWLNFLVLGGVKNTKSK